MRIKIKLLADWGEFKAGTILSMDEASGKDLIEKGVALAHDPEAEAKAAQAEVDAKAALEAEIQKRVAEEVAKAQITEKAPKSTIEVHEKIDDDPKHGFKYASEFYTAIKEAGMPSGKTDPRLLVESKAASGMNVAVDSEGGFLVPEAFSSEIMKNTYGDSFVASRAKVVPMTTEILHIPAIVETSRVDGSRQGGVRVYYKSEEAQYTKSKPTVGEVELKLNMVTGLTWWTDKLDKFSGLIMEDFFAPLFAEEFAYRIDDAFINGTGAGQPLGIMNSAALVTVDKEAAQLADTIVTENILKMYSRMPAKNRANAVWFINQDIEPQLLAMSIALGTAGVMTYMPPGGLSEAPYATLLGRPVLPIEQCATLGDKGDIIFADMGAYLNGTDSDGIQSATSIHLRFDYGETAMRWSFWHDGQPWWKSALTPAKGTAAKSPFITLAARA